MDKKNEAVVQRYVDILTNGGFKALFGDVNNKDVVISILNVLVQPQAYNGTWCNLISRLYSLLCGIELYTRAISTPCLAISILNFSIPPNFVEFIPIKFKTFIHPSIFAFFPNFAPTLLHRPNLDYKSPALSSWPFFNLVTKSYFIIVEHPAPLSILLQCVLCLTHS